MKRRMSLEKRKQIKLRYKWDESLCNSAALPCSGLLPELFWWRQSSDTAKPVFWDRLFWKYLCHHSRCSEHRSLTGLPAKDLQFPGTNFYLQSNKPFYNILPSCQPLMYQFYWTTIKFLLVVFQLEFCIPATNPIWIGLSWKPGCENKGADS